MSSKELLSEVLDPQCILTNEKKYPLEFNENYLTYHILGDVGQSTKKNINIHELAHKCKEWASKNNYAVRETFIHIETTIDVIHYNSTTFDFRVSADTEPEAIFKACEWILEQRVSS